MEVAVDKDSLAQAIGRSGQNVKLCSLITGWKLNVVDKDEVGQEEKTGSASLQVLIDYLDVDKDLASVLISEGYSSLDLIAAAKESDLNKIEGFDKEISELLINRSKEALLTLTMEISSESEGDENDLMAVKSVDMTLALELNQKGIKTRDDLAELSTEELTDIIKMDEKNAADLIMEAREHWFQEDK
jgi:N utilization substance protein A